jgi:putative ubiquitin-RnfH superfamily antitoxin RatB of RatAB toxin-antitoxin module
MLVKSKTQVAYAHPKSMVCVTCTVAEATTVRAVVTIAEYVMAERGIFLELFHRHKVVGSDTIDVELMRTAAGERCSPQLSL